MSLCVACGKLPSHWRGFCATCCTVMGLPWRQRITMGGIRDRRRAIEALRSHYASVHTVGRREEEGMKKSLNLLLCSDPFHFCFLNWSRWHSFVNVYITKAIDMLGHEVPDAHTERSVKMQERECLVCGRKQERRVSR